jgi:glycerophosphoryl diester phosphodiesterase
MIVYAHRGLHSREIPENTLAAFRAAAERGYGIETDLRTDADGRIVLFHDRTKRDRRIDQMRHAELESLTGYPVPTLDDLLAADLGVPLNLEIKTEAAFVASFVHAIPAAVATEHGIESALLLASAPLALPAPRPLLRTIVWDFNMATAATLAAATAQGWRNIVYGPRTADEHVFLVVQGVHAIISDWPDRV